MSKSRISYIVIRKSKKKKHFVGKVTIYDIRFTGE